MGHALAPIDAALLQPIDALRFWRQRFTNPIRRKREERFVRYARQPSSTPGCNIRHEHIGSEMELRHQKESPSTGAHPNTCRTARMFGRRAMIVPDRSRDGWSGVVMMSRRQREADPLVVGVGVAAGRGG